jgi:copper/silver efflux system protein
MLKSENGRLSGWVYIDLRGRALSAAVHDIQQAVARGVTLPPSYSISWSGQFEYLERAADRDDRRGSNRGSVAHHVE